MLMIREHNIVMLKITNILSTAMQLLISDHGFWAFLKSMHLPFAAIVILQNTCSWNKEEFRKNLASRKRLLATRFLQVFG